MTLKFEWDPNKGASNLKKHGVSFEQAALAFYDPNVLIRLDQDHSITEERQICLGLVESGVLMVVFTERLAGSRLRIISARRANKKERDYYHENQR